MRAVIAAFCLSLAGTITSAQPAGEWSFRGDFHAEREQHEQAVIAYEAAIELDPSLRPAILPRLARQLLWSDEPARAASLLAEHLEAGGGDCADRNDYGLALAWSDRLRAALSEYEIVIRDCPAIRNTARLRAAMVARWQDRPSLAARLYQAVTDEGTAGEKEEARVGQAYVLLMRERNRAALVDFQQMHDELPVSAALEGTAIASARLGLHDEAARLLDEAETRGKLSRDLLDLREQLAWTDRLEARPSGHAFADADGTTYQSGAILVSRGWDRRGRAGLAAGRSLLSGNARSHRASSLELQSEYRASPALAGRATLRHTMYDGGWRPVTGETHLIWTPGDDWRVDVNAGRITVTDNLTAIDNRLRGDFISIGADYRVTSGATVVAGLDRTRWSEGNHRTRIVASWRQQFEGTPRITLEVPTLVQQYDRPFSFGLFSPRRYVETGPGLNVYRRFARVWNAAAYARAGVQREDDNDWRALGNARLSLERDLRDGWMVRAAAAWSNSNVIGSGGFRRSSLTIEAARRF